MVVYRRTNTKNGKVYIGKTTRTPEQRWIELQQEVQRGMTWRVHNAIRKYGADSFKTDIIYIAKTLDELNAMETFFIVLHQSHKPENGYNMTLGGDGVSPTAETRQKISNTKRNQNLKLSPEHKNRIRIALTGKSRGPMSAEQKQKLSLIGSAPLIVKACPVCKATFETKDKKRQPIYCSKTCSARASYPCRSKTARLGRKREWLVKTCPVCVAEFQTPKNRDGKKQVYCSRSCAASTQVWDLDRRTVQAIRAKQQGFGVRIRSPL